MDKKTLSIYIIGGFLGVLVIVFTIIIAVGIQNKPLKICTTTLTNAMAKPLLKGYCNVSENEASEYISKKDIKEAYLELIDGKADVVLASDIDEETIKWLKNNGIEIESTIIAKDALVFFNSTDNPVDTLTETEVKYVFSGKYNNWNEVAGNDNEIIIYSPDYRSEEEYMMQKFMEDKSIVSPKYRLENSSLNGIIDAISGYLDTKSKAVSYTTFHNMKNRNDEAVKILKLNGVEATNETIKSNKYKAVMNIYAVTKKDISDNSQTKKFVEYITSKDGQAVIEQCGYSSLLK